MKRSLSLKREALAALGPAELGAVAAGAAPTQPLLYCLDTLGVPTADCTRISDAHTCIDCLTRWC